MRTMFRILLAALLLAAFLPCNTASASFGATATIVDDETGEPIEGAIALAQWIKTRFNFEGGFTYAARAKETVSDKEGKIRIRGYWMWIPLITGKTTLTVYKPGYALWHSVNEAVAPREYKPKDFSRSNNVVRLVKFEKAAEVWSENAHTEFRKNNPRSVHSSFLGNCFESDLDTDSITMRNIFRQYEMPFIMQESERMRREHEKSKQK